MVARDGIEPPTPAFSDERQQALTTTYKSRETAEVLGNTCNAWQLLTGIADQYPSSRAWNLVIFKAARDLFWKITEITKINFTFVISVISKIFWWWNEFLGNSVVGHRNER